MSRAGRLAATAVLLAGAVAAAGGIAELVLRVAKIPGITYHTFQYDDLTGQHYYPGTTYIYRSDRGEEVIRRVNRRGYLDRDHDLEKPRGVTRLGFFGDSFTEARQVPLDSTFASRIERALDAPGRPVECVTIGMSGYSTLQSWLECGRWMEPLGLDEIVYVFCENDPHNHVPSLNASDAVPYPVLAGDSFVVDRSFAQRYAYKARFPHRTWQYLKSHSLLFSTLETRLRLLRSRGIRLRVEDSERLMDAPAKVNAPPTASSLPSALPDSVRTLCETLTERVLLAWKEDVEGAGKRFSILYIPRPSDVGKAPGERDSWAAWLFSFCDSTGIDVIDPSARFAREAARGTELFYDHLTSRGHAAMAAEFLAHRAAATGR
jgi:hypothetical protein